MNSGSQQIQGVVKIMYEIFHPLHIPVFWWSIDIPHKIFSSKKCLRWFLAWSIGLKLRKVSQKNAITLGNSWILQNSIWERKGKVFLIQIHDLSFRHFFSKRRDKNALVWLLKVFDATKQCLMDWFYEQGNPVNVSLLPSFRIYGNHS